MSHSYEEIRSAAFEVLAGDTSEYSLDQYNHLKIEVGKLLDQYDGASPKIPGAYPADTALNDEDADLFRQVFWDMFRQGIITLGKNDRLNKNFPFFLLTAFGKKAVAEGDTYFITDYTEFEQRIRNDIPNIDEVTLIYLKESFQAFRNGCLISSAVTLGVAAERLFILLLDQLLSDPDYKQEFKGVFAARGMLSRIEKFKRVCQKYRKSFDYEIRERFDTEFLGIQQLIRKFRNESGHPTGIIIDREQAFVNLQLFIPFGKMIHRLMDFFNNAPK